MISDTFFSRCFLGPFWTLFFAIWAPSWVPSWPQNDSQSAKNRSRKVFFFALPFFWWNLNDFQWFYMFVQDLEALLASAGPMKYALFQKSVFSLPRIILESFFDAFWGLWAPLILLNRLWEALLNHSDFWSIFGSHFFDFLTILGSPRGSQGTPKIWLPTSFTAILLLLEPLQGPDACLEVIFVDFCYFFMIFECFFLAILNWNLNWFELIFCDLFCKVVCIF